MNHPYSTRFSPCPDGKRFLLLIVDPDDQTWKKMEAEKTFTLEQIAKLAGVSCTTASRVINDRPGVSPSTRERVLNIIRIYDFEPDPTARTLAAYRSRIASQQLIPKIQPTIESREEVD